MTDCLTRHRGKPSPRRVPVATVKKVFALYRETYFDLGVQHFHAKLKPDPRDRTELYLGEAGAAGGGFWWGEDANAECIANAASGGRCRGCCCISMVAVISGFRTSAGTTSS